MRYKCPWPGTPTLLLRMDRGEMQLGFCTFEITDPFEDLLKASPQKNDPTIMPRQEVHSSSNASGAALL